MNMGRDTGQMRAPLRGVMQRDEPMSRHTVWGVGGPADRVYRPADLADLAQFLGRQSAHERLFWIGLGSNLLVRDGGIAGTVILTSGLLNGMASEGEGVVRAEAGVACAKVARFCAGRRLSGSEFFAGIPGTVGGALAMNAGAFGTETWDIVRRVRTIDRDGRLHERMPDDYAIGYRQVNGPAEEWFVEGHFGLATNRDGDPSGEIRKLLRQRAQTQPTGVRSCGSVFRNPPHDFAGRLIERSGLKGARIGGAVVSEVHANFIVNTGDATAADIESLIDHVRETVARDSGVELTPEVQVLGRRGSGG